MRYPRDQKAATRAKIVDVASAVEIDLQLARRSAEPEERSIMRRQGHDLNGLYMDWCECHLAHNSSMTCVCSQTTLRSSRRGTSNVAAASY